MVVAGDITCGGCGCPEMAFGKLLRHEHTADFPFPVIADPQKRLYAEFGVGAAPRALLDPRAWLPILRAVLRSSVAVARRRERSPSLNPDGGRTGLPADFAVAAPIGWKSDRF